MAAKYRLGLDVGTASVGAAAVELNDANEPIDLTWHLVRIFDEPLEKGQGGLASKKAGRRRARMQRRQIDRRTSRLRRIAHLSTLLGLKREEIPPDDGSTLPYLRARAATERIELADLLRIFLRLSKRRGYKGEFKAKKKGEVAEGSSELEHAMKALATERGIIFKDKNDTGITLGQYLLHRLENGLPTKLKVKEVSEEPKGKKSEAEANKPRNLYALRKMVEHEFDIIWRTQAQHHDILKNDDGNIRKQFHEALFYQRPLKSAADLVAQCGLEPTLPRAPRAQMAFQRFRIEKTLADLRWGAGKHAEPLSPPQKKTIRNLLDSKDKVKFEEIYEVLEKAGCPKPQTRLNLDRASREELLGNNTLAALRKLDKHSAKHHPDRATDLEATFRALDDKTQIAAINFLAELGSPEQLDDPEWHTCFVKRDGTSRKFSESFIAFVNQIKEHEKFDRLNKMDFDGGRASYSVKALNKLADWLEEPSWPGDWRDDMKRMDEEAAIRVCYPQSFNREVKRMDKLPVPNPTGNAVVDGALCQIRWTLNKMIDELGAPPSEIVVELAREMSLGITRRNERESDNNAQQKARREAEKEIRAHNQTPTPSRIRRYLLWKEQDSHCPYCGDILSLAQALAGSITEYEHIIPKSLTQSGMKRSEIVIAHLQCNQEKGDRTPWEAWGGTPRWAHIKAAAMRFEKKKQFRKAKLLRLQDFEREVLTDESINGFAERQFHQTSWIAKEALQWLECLCPNKVSVSRGELTAMTRRKWGLETVIPEVRVENNLPVLDEEGKSIAPEDFANLKKYLEGHPVLKTDRDANPGFDFNRRPDKRIDHRHHLIDAITLALTSRGLFQKMAKDYKTVAEQRQWREGESQENFEKRMKFETQLRLRVPEPPLPDVRDKALAAVRECRIAIKPDRYPDAEMFKGTAYGVGQRDGENRLRLTLRQAIADLGKSQGKTSAGSARKTIANIVSDDVRRIVSDAFDSRISQGMEAGAALAKPILHPLYGKPIHKVRCFEGYAEEAQPIGHTSRQGEHRKYLVNGGYAYLELATDSSQEPRLAKIRDAMRDKKRPEKQGVLRIYKGDVVKDSKDGLLYRVCLFKAAGIIAILPIWEPRSFKEANEKAPAGSKVGGTISFSPAAKRLSIING
ncbi:MAG: type II CRISPR RNA-guided endonuclease Cas9 [Betaproteobacteria bacterium]|nr:type II CRISPR RNA-guided endonuclease Cas9 [Betaproteobacteria bacterium]